MFTKKRLVLTATMCNLLENLRQAIELLIGQEIRFESVELNLKSCSGKGFIHFRDGDRDIRAEVIFDGRSQSISKSFVEFNFSCCALKEYCGKWYANFHENRITVEPGHGKFVNVIGSSIDDRTEQPCQG